MHLFERIKTITNELSQLIYSKKQSINNFSIKDGHFKTIAEVDRSDNKWKDFQAGELWGGKDTNHWFRTNFTIPEDFHKKPVALVVTTGDQGWDAVNPQFILFLNGELIQGLDINHREIIIEQNAEAGLSYQLDLHAYAGTVGDHGRLDYRNRLYVDLVVVDQSTKDLYYNIHVPWLVLEKSSPEDKQRIDIINILNETINLLDLRKPYSENYYQSVNTANQYIKQNFYDKLSNTADTVATVIGHTHIDIAWWWTVAQTRQKVIRSFSTVLNLMNEYPEYLFMSSQPQLYQFVKEDQPELYNKIKKKVNAGSWEPEGAMWVEADTNVTSGESLVRQILFGKNFFKEEFDVENEILWLPDVFGYSAALPQILKKAEIQYFMTTKISWNQYNKLPMDTFMWRGIDGTEIFTHFITTQDPYQSKGSHFTTYNGQLHPGAIIGAWDRYQQKEINNDVLICYGYGDGGGGPTKEMLEIGRRLNKGLPGCPKVQQGKSKDYFDRVYNNVKDHKYLPTWVGELYLEYHRGTYTSMARNKRANRKNELLYQAIEVISSIAMLNGYNYQQQKINKAWETILLNQFHDILPGSSIKEVYDVTKEEYQVVEKNGKELLNHSLSYISSQINLLDKSIVVFNTLSFERSDIAKVKYSQELANLIIVDENDKILPCQMIVEKAQKYLLFYAENIPSCGYKTFRLIPGKIVNQPSIEITNCFVETTNFRLELNEQGHFTSIYDKKDSREVLKESQQGNVLIAYEDKPMNFDNWDIEDYYVEKKWGVDHLENIKVIENGNVRSCLELTRFYHDSKIIQKIYFYEHSNRIDFETYVDWKEHQTLLKVEFPVDIHTDKATYEIQFGNVERPAHKNTSWDKARFEVCAHKWVDVSEEGYGVSLLNDCKYGHDIIDSNLRLTLIKSGIVPNPVTDQEEHYFTYSVFPHKDNWKQAKTIQQAYSLNVPLYSVLENKHYGTLKDHDSFVHYEANNIVIDTIKKAEKTDKVIIRLYEAHNKRSQLKLSFYQNIKTVTLVNLMEKEIKPLNFDQNVVELAIKPFEIVTLSIEF
ncbi:MAG: alpha-mannosidase [Spirochaetes bacterium]|nr:alpha-mannosidase [Spirochaetota bacterium]